MDGEQDASFDADCHDLDNTGLSLSGGPVYGEDRESCITYLLERENPRTTRPPSLSSPITEEECLDSDTSDDDNTVHVHPESQQYSDARDERTANNGDAGYLDNQPESVVARVTFRHTPTDRVCVERVPPKESSQIEKVTSIYDCIHPTWT